jgi:hypothetical protein
MGLMHRTTGSAQPGAAEGQSMARIGDGGRLFSTTKVFSDKSLAD